MPPPSIAVVGAGVSGLVCAKELHAGGCRVTVFDKSRGLGGRMACRRAGEGLRFDHGAQYFTARDNRFRAVVSGWLRHGVAAVWDGPIVTLENGEAREKGPGAVRYVGTPAMNTPCKVLAEGLDVRFQTRVTQARRRSGASVLYAESADVEVSLGDYDLVVLALPAPQARDVLPEGHAFQERLAGVCMQGCWAAMIALQRPLGVRYDGAFIEGSPLSWAARCSSKPGREEEPETWVLHAGHVWSDAHIEDPPEAVLPRLIGAFWEATGHAPVRTAHEAAHRWRYAIPLEPLQEAFLFDADTGFGVCGDWCGGPRVEGAFLSGLGLAERVLKAL